MEPSYGEKIGNMNEFQAKVKKITHVAVRRMKLGYFHHYLVLDLSKGCVCIIHYTSGKEAYKSFSLVKVQIQDLHYSETNSDLFDFDSDLYFIKRPEYPSTKGEEKRAYDRALSRLNETNYAASINNCEHLVTWILTGVSTCEQVSGALPRFKADSIDSVVTKKTVATAVLSDFGAKTVVGKATSLLSKSGKVLATISKADNAVNAATKAVKVATKAFKKADILAEKSLEAFRKAGNGFKDIAKITNCRSAIFHAKKAAIKAAESHLADKAARQTAVAVQDAAQTALAAKDAAKALIKSTVNMSRTTAAAISAGKACGISVAFSLPFEIATSAYTIYNLHQQKKKGYINNKQFYRETTKTVAGSVSSIGTSTLGTFLGAFVGSFVPIPAVGTVVGGVIGGVLGSLFGRLFGSAIAGRAYDAIKGK